MARPHPAIFSEVVVIVRLSTELASFADIFPSLVVIFMVTIPFFQLLTMARNNNKDSGNFQNLWHVAFTWYFVGLREGVVQTKRIHCNLFCWFYNNNNNNNNNNIAFTLGFSAFTLGF